MKHPPKYPSTKHWPWSETVHRDDSVHDIPEAFWGQEIVITEKLDGGNTCLWGGEVYARSTSQPSHDGWMAMVRKHHGWRTMFTPDDEFYYGEDLYGIHSIEYDPLPEAETYYLFAVRKGDTFLSWDDVKDRAHQLSVPTAPELFRGSFNTGHEITEWFQENLKLPSTLGKEREGFVMRWADPIRAIDFSRKTAKYVRANHVQTDQHWTKNWQPCKLKG